MKSLTFGDIPEDLTIEEPYEMGLNASDLETFAAIVSQGMDSHLEAVFFTEHSRSNTHCHVTIDDSKSMRCFLRRCMESDNEDAESLASSIMETLGFEWI